MIGAALALVLALVGAARDTTRVPAIVTRAPLDTAAPVNFRVLVTPDTVYVGEQVTYQLGVFLDQSVRDRLRRMEALAPEMRGMMAYDPPAPLSGFAPRVLGSRRYEAHVYQRAIFPLSAGRHVIPPARLVYAMPLSYSFFSREESFELRSDSVVIVAVAPPAEGRPAGFAGAVGRFAVRTSLEASPPRVGDPILLTIAVSGYGNVKLLPRPALDIPWATAVPAGERVDLAGDSLVLHGEKEFDWVITPQRSGPQTLPPVRYPFFDPASRQYQIAVSGSRSVLVAPGLLANADTGSARPRWTVRARYRGPLPEPMYEGRPFWALLLAAPLPAVAFFVVRRPPRAPRRRRVPSRVAQLRLLARASARPGGAAAGAREVRRAFLGAVAERLRISATALAEPAALAHALRRAGATGDTAARAAELLEELNAGAYAAGRALTTDASARAHALYAAIDAETRRPRRAVPPPFLLIGALLVAASAWAAAPLGDDAQFARGVESYEHGRYAIAARDFGALAGRQPRAADAWANLGTAAFAAGDTARAALGWQRALRLEPLAGDVRERLELLMPTTGGAPGAVPPVPPLPLVLVATVLWLAGWGVLAWRWARPRRAPGGAVALAAVGAAIAFAAAAASIDRRLAARDLYVVAHDEPLRVLPALGADRAGGASAGDVLRLVARSGQWAHVTTDGRGDGWIETGALLPLARD